MAIPPLQIGSVTLGGAQPLFILGPCVIESEEFVWRMARSLHEICTKLAKGDTAARRHLQTIGHIGNTVIDSLAEYFSEKHNRSLVERLTRQVKINDVRPAANDSPIAGKTVVFTGALERMTREEAEETAERLGAKAVRSVSKHTDYVIAGPGAGTKLDKARGLGVRVLSEDEWSKLMGDAVAP